MLQSSLMRLVVSILILFCSFFHHLARAEDPFEDASAFGMELAEEEEDDVFFYKSRFVMLGSYFGLRTFTGGLGEFIDAGFQFGGYIDYFFTVNLAGEVTLDYSFHDFLLPDPAGDIKGTTSLFNVVARLKYYFASELFTKAAAFANPYIFSGAGSFHRFIIGENTVTRTTGFARDNAFGFDFGGGLEFPLYQKRIFAGIQLAYDVILFPSENVKTPGGIGLDGDALSFGATFAYNF